MKALNKNTYLLTVGIIGAVSTLLLTIFNGNYFNVNPFLFIILGAVAIASRKIQFRVGDFTLTFDITALIASYFILGLVPTLWLIFITNFIYAYIVDKSRVLKDFYNASLLLIMFIMIHFIYEITGFSFNGVLGAKSRISIGVFSLLIFVLNWGLIFLDIGLTGGKLPKGWFEGLSWDFYGNIIVIPLSIGLIEFYYKYEFLGLILLSFTIFIANVLFRLIRNLVFTNNELKVVHEVSVSISSGLELSETTSNIINGIKTLVNCEYCSIIYFDKDTKSAKIMDSNLFYDMPVDEKSTEDYFTENLEKILMVKESIIVNDNSFIIKPSSISKDIKSFIFEPLLQENETIGCIVICSNDNTKFFKEQLMIMDILASQAVIAIENAKSYKEAKNKAIRDSLTGLYNQRYFFDVLDSLNDSCRLCQKNDCTGCNSTSLVILDIDHFKKVNDTYGHPTGDKILREVTNIIKNNVRKSDIVSRYGGEEFTIILPNTKEEIAHEIADRIREAVESTQFYTLENKPIKITISGGVSEFPTKAHTGSTLLTNADRAMYSGSKQKGRNKISRYVS